jgi:hypothetical protein
MLESWPTQLTFDGDQEVFDKVLEPFFQDERF